MKRAHLQRGMRGLPLRSSEWNQSSEQYCRLCCNQDLPQQLPGLVCNKSGPVAVEGGICHRQVMYSVYYGENLVLPTLTTLLDEHSKVDGTPAAA